MVIQVFVCMALSSALRRLPPEFRKQDPAMVWLLLIPFIRQIWNFFVYPKIAESYKAYYAAQTNLGEVMKDNSTPPLILNEIQSLESLTLAYSICATATILPQLAICLYFPILAFNIIVLLKISGIKSKISLGAGGFPLV